MHKKNRSILNFRESYTRFFRKEGVMALQGSPRFDYSVFPPAHVSEFMGHAPLDSRIIGVDGKRKTIVMWFKGHDPTLKNGRFVQGYTGSETIVVAEI